MAHATAAAAGLGMAGAAGAGGGGSAATTGGAAGGGGAGSAAQRGQRRGYGAAISAAGAVSSQVGSRGNDLSLAGGDCAAACGWELAGCVGGRGLPARLDDDALASGRWEFEPNNQAGATTSEDLVSARTPPSTPTSDRWISVRPELASGASKRSDGRAVKRYGPDPRRDDVTFGQLGGQRQAANAQECLARDRCFRADLDADGCFDLGLGEDDRGDAYPRLGSCGFCGRKLGRRGACGVDGDRAAGPTSRSTANAGSDLQPLEPNSCITALLLDPAPAGLPPCHGCQTASASPGPSTIPGTAGTAVPARRYHRCGARCLLACELHVDLGVCARRAACLA